MPEAQCPTPEF